MLTQYHSQVRAAQEASRRADGSYQSAARHDLYNIGNALFMIPVHKRAQFAFLKIVLCDTYLTSEGAVSLAACPAFSANLASCCRRRSFTHAKSRTNSTSTLGDLG